MPNSLHARLSLRSRTTLPQTAQPSLPRSIEFALLVTGGIWALGARTAAVHAAAGLASRPRLLEFQPLLASAFFLFLLLIGFTAIHWVATRTAVLREVNPLPVRPTVGREWRMGAAVGWGTLLLTLLPMALAGDLSPHFWWQPRGIGLMLLSLLTLALFTLAAEVLFRGYLLVRLSEAVGPTLATLLLAAIYAGASAFHPLSTRLSVFVTFLLGILLSMAYFRTHALWLPWGLHFAWSAGAAVLFGLPVSGIDTFPSVVDTSVSGADWLTGGYYGPEGSAVAIVLILCAMVAVYHLTSDFAWQYTFHPPAPAGYPMDAPPPAEHVAMERSARPAAPAPLVQILSATPSAPSTSPAVEQHLRREATADIPD